MDNIINSDPTLKYLIRDAKIDYYNEHKLNLRIAALKIALYKFIEQISP